MQEIEILQKWVNECHHIVFFGGAGTSTDAGIPDFRSEAGLYSKDIGGYPPEYLLSHEYLLTDPEGFSRFYKKHLIFPQASPTLLHQVLKTWEDEGKLLAIITQNIDGLHQMAGNRRVIEIHGNLTDHYCTECGKTYSQKDVLSIERAFYCSCGGFVRPDVTLYGEAMDAEAFDQAIRAIRQADLLIVAGTSLVVYPAAGLIRYFRGERLAVINRGPIKRNLSKGIYLNASLHDVFLQLKENP